MRKESGEFAKMAQIIDINKKTVERYKEISGRIEELEKILGYDRDENGNSLSRRSSENMFAARKMEQLKRKNPDAYKEMLALEAEQVELEKQLGLDEAYEEMMDRLGIQASKVNIWE